MTCEADLRPGGSFRYVFQRPSGKKLELRGAYKEIDSPNRWVYTETYDFFTPRSFGDERPGGGAWENGPDSNDPVFVERRTGW